MEQHKTIDRRAAMKKQNAGAAREHKVIDRRQATPEVTTTGAGRAAAPVGAYQPPRNYGEQRGFYEARVTETRTAMEQQQEAFREAQRALEQLNRQVQEKRQRYYDLHGTFEGDTAQEYEGRIMAEWTEAVDLYGQGKQSWQKAYDAYKPYEDAYNAAVTEYNTYMAGERAAYDGWKASIRPADSIREEQKGIKEKRAELQRRMQMANDIASGTAAPGIMAQAAQNEAAIRELQEYLGGAGDREKLLQEELDWSEHFRFEDLRQNADFAQKSRYVSSGTGEGLKVDPMTGQTYGSMVGDRQYEVVNRNAAALGEQAMGDVNNEWSHLQTMTDGEIAMYNYLYATRGPQGAAEYLGHLRQELTARQMEGYNELIGQTVETGGVPGAVLASAGSLLLSPFAGVQTALGQLGYKLAGQEIDPNAGYALGTNTKNALRQSVSQKIEENAGPVGSFAYQTVMSMGDMLMDATIGGPAAMALIGTRGFSEGVIDAKHRGLSDGQALTLGAVAGLAEVLTEKLGVDERLRLPEKWKTAGFWKGALHGAIGEGSEEALTNIVNLVADLTVAGEESEFMRTVRENMAQQTMPDGSVKTGMSEEEATKKAVWAALGSVGLDFLGGAVSGGVFGGWNGWQGKKAAAQVQEKAGKAAKPPEGELPPQSQSDSSPIPDGTGEPLGDGTQAVPYEEKAVTAQNGESNVQKTDGQWEEPDAHLPGPEDFVGREGEYYRRQGEGGKEMAEAAKKAAGTAATAVLINSIWGTTVDLLAKALKGKLDEEDKEPLQIAEDFFWGVIDSYAGMVTVGDIIAEVVGGWFTGEKAYSTEAPGIEQFNDIKEAADKIINAGKKGNLIGAIKIAAETVASYGFGLPTKNVEAYLMGLFSWALPGAKVAYEDLLKAPAKADLKGLEGKALTVRLNHVLKGYGVELEPEVREALAALYEAGYTEAVPSAAPDAVTVDGVELELDGRMKKEYDKTRGGIIEQELPEITGSAFFAQADEKTRKAMVTKLYNYAAEKAKKAVLEDYPIGTTAQAIDEIVRAGGSAADYAVFDSVTADMAAWQRAEVLQEWGADEAVTGLMFKHLVSKSWEDEQAELRRVGVDVGQFLELYAMHGEIDIRDLKAGQKATEFAYWLDGQRYTDQQKAVIKDQMAYFQMMPADASRYNTATAAGLDRDQAMELTGKLNELEPPEGKTSVQQIQKWRVGIDNAWAPENQLRQLKAVGMDDAAYAKCEALWEAGVAPAAYVRAKELESQFDSDGNGSLTNEDWRNLINSLVPSGIALPGDNERFNMTNEQMGFLWQMLAGNESTKNNPFSKTGGEKWLEIKNADK